MIDVLIFSKNRAAQLDLLLRSIDRHAPWLYASKTVLYRATDPDYMAGYTRCVGAHAGTTRFVEERDFEKDVRAWLQLARPFVSFLVDDDAFYRDAPDDAWGVLVPFSLRGGDYDYPFSVDGNVYVRNVVENLLEPLTFTNPTMLEANAHNARDRLPFDTVAAVEPPCLVGIPANRVSESSGMPHMGVSERDLNDAYLEGVRLECVFDRDVYPAHWPVAYTRVYPVAA